MREEELFLDLEMADFHLDTMSVAIMKATPIGEIPFDLEDNLRDGAAPDIGCYEFQD